MSYIITASIGLEEPHIPFRELSRVVVSEPLHPSAALIVTVQLTEAEQDAADTEPSAAESQDAEAGAETESRSWQRTLALFPD